MTQHVRTAYRKNRKRTLTAAVAVLAAGVLAIVLPALAAPGQDIPPASGNDVTPIEVAVGGSNFDCQASYVTGDRAPHTFKINNPANGSFTTNASGSPVTFEIKNIPSSGNNRDKIFDFTVTGASVLDLGVNGGTNTAHYAYPGYVSSDTDLHATRQSANKLYSLSHLTFCYATVGTIDGAVFVDLDQNGSQQAGESGLAGAVISLYLKNGVTGSQALRTSPATGASGSYVFEDVPLGPDYVLCQTAPGGYALTAPIGNTVCTSVSPKPGLDPGHEFEFTADATKNFANVPTAEPSCTDTFSGVALGGTYEYTAQLQAIDGECKEDDLVMYTYEGGNNDLFATLHPITEPDAEDPKYAVVEHIVWNGFGSEQNPVTLWYDDTYPYDGANKRTMLLCGSDTRTGPDSFELASTPDMPAADGNGDHTSCMLESTDGAGGTYGAWVFSEVDGLRGVG